jgi:hypothetical protein
MAKYLVIRTSDDDKDWLWNEVQQGRLRQGWGLSNMELPRGQDTIETRSDWCERYQKQGEQHWKEKISLTDAQRRYRILRPMVDVQVGDRLIIPKMPTWGSFCIGIANGTYQFDNSKRSNPEGDDFRHIIPIDAGPRIIPHLSSAAAQIVASSLNAYRPAVNLAEEWKIGEGGPTHRRGRGCGHIGRRHRNRDGIDSRPVRQNRT